MKQMNREAKESLLEVAQKLLKDAQNKKKQSEDLLVEAKLLEETAKKLTKEIDSIQITDE
jgi:hypothetical protein